MQFLKLISIFCHACVIDNQLIFVSSAVFCKLDLTFIDLSSRPQEPQGGEVAASEVVMKALKVSSP